MSELAAAPSAERPENSRAAALAAVFLGGAAGTELRWLVGQAVDPASAAAWSTWLVNVTGSLVIGWLTARWAGAGPSAVRRWWRLCLVPGLLGGYTTYSAFALQTQSWVTAGQPGRGVAYALITVLAGALAALLGLRLGRTSVASR